MNYDAFGIRLRTCRLENHVTLNELANVTHYSPKHLGNVERGYARPSLELIISLANCLDICPFYLLQDSLMLPDDCHNCDG